VLRYTLEGSDKEQVAAVSWGYAQVTPLGVNILAETAETPKDIDLTRAQMAEKKAETELANLDLDAEMIEKYLSKLERARIRREVAEKSTNH
jgi:F-type H+-transporting ATPase subunit epsilon